ncbi:hypothetical protein G7B40_038645 [Aetokthonos hydrillicola Thurmond2011]|jgi:hypothetical protein|uniref:Uncharacterized protein n=1 Tax=Aetokthonos hydrillicola Thurmond2011 TaxID=2712845 RepID=A0AAP5ME59_9CYAN|nr:hypothetical protein [Aetokthonos hydrillicola]MBO3461363.1 hypothetical protein [Aetokthonos hydrillicola CCALA 1050]MBW4589240.1 hypothetical protein [Aetokthonos hydrillicola CCALA 1050]MDR9900424.1 hypothetical protein [Aetokthonos hydrillicola Thurmond2011]
MEYKLLSLEEFNEYANNASMRIETWKTEYGILQKMFLAGQLLQKTPSPRPFQLGQVCDGTTNTCVIALFILYCRASKLDPQDIMETAYPVNDWSHFTAEYQQKQITAAQMEGIEVPKSWKSPRELDRLCVSLREINLHQLANILEKSARQRPSAALLSLAA